MIPALNICNIVTSDNSFFVSQDYEVARGKKFYFPLNRQLSPSSKERESVGDARL